MSQLWEKPRADRFVEVAVNTPVADPPPAGTFSYSLPSGLAVEIGQAVLVPFGARTLFGIVFDIVDTPQVSPVRDILAAVDPLPALTPHRVALARWIAQYYRSPLYACAALMLPPDLQRRLQTVVAPVSSASSFQQSLSPLEEGLLERLKLRGSQRLERLRQVFGKETSLGVERLRRLGLVTVDNIIGPPHFRPKVIRYVAPADIDRCRAALENARSRAPKRAAILERLLTAVSPLPLAEVVLGGMSSIAPLVADGLVVVSEVEVRRDPLAHRAPPQPSEALVLSPAQAAVWNELHAAIESPMNGRKPFLLHGVTGSGKTELYLQALAATVARGRQGIVLVPEIALTPQTIDRFRARFPDRVGVLHSGLTAGEHFDEWHRARGGTYDVVIGPRGAIFAPLERLGLICIDEEHEPSYKQDDPSPRYHARNVALKLAELTGSTVILGSATPSIESYRLAERGEFRLLRLPDRVTSAGRSLPEVEIVDMRAELRAGAHPQGGVFSRSLAQALVATVGAGEQAILFLNRRGTSTVVLCRNCGHVIRCRRCDTVLTYHSEEGALVCHQCNRLRPIPVKCPECGNPSIRFLGMGTQRVAAAVAALLPKSRILRWDRDAISNRRSHEAIMARFVDHEADILVGTQMVAKGLDLPQVTLVGVVNADVGLYLPDFRAAERSFQLLTQVAGRAGRGDRPGKVIFQTYSAEHFAVVAAAKQDYESFYERELELRRRFGNPPFNRLLRLTHMAANAAAAQRESERLGRRLRARQVDHGLSEIEILGPTPAYVDRIRGRYRWQIVLRGPEPELILQGLRVGAAWAIDVDPVSLL